jgi:hypothetical protein
MSKVRDSELPWEVVLASCFRGKYSETPIDSEQDGESSTLAEAIFNRRSRLRMTVPYGYNGQC